MNIDEATKNWQSEPLGIETIGHIARVTEKRVVCVAGGLDRVEAIRTGLRGRHFDEQIAKQQ